METDPQESENKMETDPRESENKMETKENILLKFVFVYCMLILVLGGAHR